MVFMAAGFFFLNVTEFLSLDLRYAAIFMTIYLPFHRFVHLIVFLSASVHSSVLAQFLAGVLLDSIGRRLEIITIPVKLSSSYFFRYLSISFVCYEFDKNERRAVFERVHFPLPSKYLLLKRLSIPS